MIVIFDAVKLHENYRLQIKKHLHWLRTKYRSNMEIT